LVFPHIPPTTKDLLRFLKNSLLPIGLYQDHVPFQSFVVLSVELGPQEYYSAMQSGIDGLCSITALQAYSSYVPPDQAQMKFLAAVKEAESDIRKTAQGKLDHIDWLICHGATMTEEALIYLIRTVFAQARLLNTAHVIRKDLFAFFRSRVQGRGFQSPRLCWELLKLPSLDLCAWLLIHSTPMTQKFLNKVNQFVKSPFRPPELRKQLTNVLELITLWNSSRVR